MHGRMGGSDLTETIASAGAAGFTPQDKLRLVLSFLATHPGECDSDKLGKLVAAAGLGEPQVQALRNLEYLGIMLTKTCGCRGRSRGAGAAAAAEDASCTCACMCAASSSPAPFRGLARLCINDRSCMWLPS